MAQQRHPDTPHRLNEYTERAPRGSAAASVIGSLAVVAVIAYVIFVFSGNRAGDPVALRSPSATAPTTAPPSNTPTPTPPSPTKPQ